MQLKSVLIAGLAAGLALSGCGDKPATNSFCDLHQGKDFTDPALRKQNRHNKTADKVNEATRVRLCL